MVAAEAGLLAASCVVECKQSALLEIRSAEVLQTEEHAGSL